MTEDRNFDVEPGDSLKLEVKVENLFPDDIKIEDIVMDISFAPNINEHIVETARECIVMN